MAYQGMTQAYDLIGAHALSGMEIAVILHLGWRDHPHFRTARGIARALAKDRKNIARVLRALQVRGLLRRLGDLWAFGPADPSTVSGDAEAPGVERTPPGVDAPGVTVTPPPGSSRPLKGGPCDPPMRKRKERRREPRPALAFGEPLGRVARSEITAGRSAVVAGRVIRPGTPEFVALRERIEAEKRSGEAMAGPFGNRAFTLPHAPQVLS